ncbi:MAG: glycosyltransferase, partial [Trueperaceae bacterium]|nr:glycosyltransferase [Trueperaceae bacterium]
MTVALALLAVLVLGHVAVLVWVAIGVVLAPAAPTRRAPPFADGAWPSVDVIVPAHDEAAALPATLASLRSLAYPGRLSILVVDDRSTDGTGDVVRAAAA